MKLAILLPICSILLCQIFCFYSVEVEAASIVDETCRQVAAFLKPKSSYDFCVATLRADPKSATADIRGLTVIAARQAANNLRASIARINDLLGGSQATKGDKSALAACKEFFETGISNVGYAIVDLYSDRLLEAQTRLSGLSANVMNCKESFEQVGGTTNIFAKEINDGARYAELPLDVASLI